MQILPAFPNITKITDSRGIAVPSFIILEYVW